MTKDTLLLITGGESKCVELKKEYTKSLLKTVSAFANYHDGRIIIGVTDQGEVTGVNDISQLRLNIENAINDNIHPRPYFELHTQKINDKQVLIIKVFKGEYTPYYYQNKAYKRSDTATVEIDRIELNRLILEGQNFSYEELEAPTQALTFEQLENRFRNAKKINSLTRDVLKSLELIKNEKYNIAAALLSDENPVENAKVILVKYSENLMHIQDRRILNNISIIKQFEACIDFYYKHTTIREIIQGPYRETQEAIPLVAFREAVANAIVHRDYMAKGEIKIEFFPDQVNIISPGGLPPGISKAEYLDGRLSVPRNRILADIFLRLGIIEKLATGIRRIKEYYSSTKRQPEFIVGENSIKVVLPIIDMPTNMTSFSNNEDSDTVKIINYLKENGAITRKTTEKLLAKGKTQTYKQLKNLVDQGYLVRIGTGKKTKYVLK